MNIKKYLTSLFYTMVIISHCLTISAWGTTYYVAKGQSNASDANAGTESQPWKTIQHGVDMASPGDTVYVKEGIYQERVQLTGTTGVEGKSGNTTNGYITYAGYPGHSVILDGSNFTGWGSGFISGVWAAGARAVNYITLKNFTVRNYPETGIDIRGHSEDMTISVGSHHINIEAVTVHNNGYDGIFIVGGSEMVNGTSYEIHIRNCIAYRNGYHGIKFSGDSPGVLNRGHIHNSSVTGCTAYENGLKLKDGIGIFASTGAYQITIKNNTTYNNMMQGIGGHEIWDSTYENNTSYSNGKRTDVEDDGIVIWSSRNMKILNNNVHDNPRCGLWLSGDSPSTFTVYGNDAYDNTECSIAMNGAPYSQTDPPKLPSPPVSLRVKPNG